MKFTEIKYIYNSKEYTVVERESDYTYGNISYYEGVVNRIKSLTQSNAKIIDVIETN